MQEFEIEGIKNNKFRFREDIDPTSIIAFGELITKEDIKSRTELYNFALDSTEVLIGGSWEPVRREWRDNTGKVKYVYLPVGIEKDVTAIQSIVYRFLDEIILSTFQKSSE